jgi:hypothetical protein
MYKYGQQSVICSEGLGLIPICMLYTNCLCDLVLHILLFFLLSHKFDTRCFVRRHLVQAWLPVQTRQRCKLPFPSATWATGVEFSFVPYCNHQYIFLSSPFYTSPPLLFKHEALLTSFTWCMWVIRHLFQELCLLCWTRSLSKLFSFRMTDEASKFRAIYFVVGLF